MSGIFAYRKSNKTRLALTAGSVVGALLLIGVLTDIDPTGSLTAATSTNSQHVPTTASSIPFAAPPDSPATPLSSESSPPAQPADVNGPAALAKLATLPVKGRAPKTGYDRSLFGHPWSDDVTVTDGHNSCDTRNDILRRDLSEVEIKPGSHDCAVLSGLLHDPYTGITIEFRRGQSTSSQVPIDHVVALSDAWQKGAQQWDSAKRRNFANDPINLQATIGSINRQKSDGDAATWLPPNKSYRCTYVSRIVDVKTAYGLWVTQAEHDAIARILNNCGASAVTAPPSRMHHP
ncbi:MULTISPECIES: HNH endonuclease family protein [Mycobacterium ulcerans group]|uniref:Hypothetical secreted protein n=1 Tax=Mycobacterium marinum DL240490 TaxID=459420 RepID=B6CLL5_MYCMR|nr:MULTISPECIES: HNH endonuclease family protein [Mycobacterium ulcerans group]ACA50939.1 hypothetical secreted protein [Mycobacterium marinum DL240490]MBC9862661.1 hypothetical protein [Mycobacterium pseudoshottsii]